MKPKKLVMSAFGSYAGVETIDFERMDHGLFLIAGDTGSGKSTIFDAIMFALYDTMSSKERRGNMMRSEYAKESAETYVEYTFAYGAAQQQEIYTVRRYPSYERRSKRKNRDGVYGMIRQPGKVSLILPDGKEFPGKAVQTNQKIREIIGLNAEQFGKIAMIAQGDFQDLIMDKTGKRKEIFQQIFSTEIYERIQKKIYERFKAGIAAVKENTTKLREAVSGLEFSKEEKAAQWKEMLTFLETEPERLHTFLREEIAEEKQAEKTAKKEAACAQRLVTEREVAYQDAVKWNSLFQDYEAACRQKEELAGQATLMQERQRRVEVSQKAQKVLAVQEKYRREEREKEQLEQKKEAYAAQERKQKERLRESLSRQKEWKAQYEKRMPDILREQERLKDEMLLLEQLVQCQRGLEKLRRDVIDVSQKWDTSKQEAERLLQVQRQIQQWLQEHSQTEVRLEQLSHRLEEMQKQKRQLQRYQELYQEWKNAVQVQEGRMRQVLQEQKDWTALRRLYEERDREYFAGQSALLAAKLKSGEPCPVCGSCVHPEPAEFTGGAVTKEQLDETVKQEEKKRKELEAARLEFQTAKVQQEQLWKKVLEDTEELFEGQRLTEKVLSDEKAAESILRQWQEENRKRETELRQSQKELQEQIRRGKEQQQRAEELSGRVLKLQETEKQLAQQKQRWELEQKRLETEESMLRERVTILSVQEGKEAQKRLAGELFAGQEKSRELDECALQEKKAYDTLIGNQAENEKRWREYTVFACQSYEEYQNALQEQGFSDEGEYTHALQWQKEAEQWKRELDGYRMKQVECEARCHMLQEQLRDRSVADTQVLAAQKESAVAVYEERKAAQEAVTYHLETMKRVEKRVKELLQGREVLTGESRAVRSLQNAANGKQQFQTYVLRQYFQKIIHAANLRLKKMTTNPFLLKCGEWNASGQGETGLDLDVWNPLTGKSRDAHTLSGGETFLASLSMALGMADVVQNTVGRTHLDTMFIDEGFGSLSEDVRTTAVKVLLELAGQQRLVGVISHVSELKEQIPDKLYVTKDNSGSRVCWQQD